MGDSAVVGVILTSFKSRLERAHWYKSLPTDLVKTGATVERVSGRSQPFTAELADSWASLKDMHGPAAWVMTTNAANIAVPDAVVDLVVSDPPYMDNVHYAELADFFHAWLREMHPFEGYSQSVSTRRDGEVQQAEPAAIGEAIEAVWRECARVLKPGGLLAFTFHQARISGWVQLIDALHRAGFCSGLDPAGQGRDVHKHRQVRGT